MFKCQQNIQHCNQKKFRWTLSKKIGGLATSLLLLLGGVSSYFYFEIHEISRELEEIGQSDFPLYETTTQLLLYEKEKQLLLEEVNYIINHVSEDPRPYYTQIAYKLDRVEQNINKTLLQGKQQAQFALQEEQAKEDKIRLNQEKEDYQKLQLMFLKLELDNQKFNLVIEQFLYQAINYSIPPPTSSIRQARLELQVSQELTQEILQTLKAHIDGSVSATVDERAIAVTTNALIALGALLFGLFFSTWVTRQITSSINKVTQQAKLIADNIERESLNLEALAIDTNDEIRDLSIAFNRMVNKFLDSQAERKKISEQIFSEKELAQWQAQHDSLTGLVNRRQFEDQLSQKR